MQYDEPEDLTGKSVYNTSGEKLGEVEKVVLLKDGKGALLLKHTNQIILMETVRNIADIVLVAQTETKPPIPTEEIRSKASVESTRTVQIEQASSQPDRFASAASVLPFERIDKGALVEVLEELLHEHAIRSVRNAALSNLLDSELYRGLRELLVFVAESLIPHEKTEEESVFPVIVQWQPSKEPLVRELSKEHEEILDTFMQIRRTEGSGNVAESKQLSQEVLRHLNDHYKREDPLFQQVLKELSST